MAGVWKRLRRRDDEDATAKVGLAREGPVASCSAQGRNHIQDSYTSRVPDQRAAPIEHAVSGCIRGYHRDNTSVKQQSRAPEAIRSKSPHGEFIPRIPPMLESGNYAPVSPLVLGSMHILHPLGENESRLTPRGNERLTFGVTVAV